MNPLQNHFDCVADQFEKIEKPVDTNDEGELKQLLGHPPADNDPSELPQNQDEIDESELRKYVDEDSPLSSPTSERGLSSLPIAGATVTLKTRGLVSSSSVSPRSLVYSIT